MSKISDKLNIISDAKDDIKTAIENKGVSVGNIGIQEYASKIDEIIGSEVYPDLQEKTVVPTNEVQEVTPDDGIYGLSKVTVDKVNLQNKTVTPSSSEQIVKADSEYNGLNEVVVNGDDNLISENIVEGKTIFGVDGTAKTGGGGTTIEKGLVINACDSDGYPTDISLVGFTEIPKYYFWNTFYLYTFGKNIGANLHLPNNITTINEYGFYGCSNLALTELPSEITKIKEYGFYGCKNLALTELPSGITSIDRYGFRDCENISLTKLPSKLTTISQECFSNCSNLALTELPSGITSISQYAFTNCTSLAITEIPNGVKIINQNAFKGCTNLVEITIQGDVTSISANSFLNCSKLEKIVIPNITSIPTLGSTAFNGTAIKNGNGYIYVPNDLVESLKGASNWSAFGDQIKGVSEL